jgi:hypothetical protein
VSDIYEKISFYKGLYKEIAVGFSEDKYLGKPIFIKHFTELENGDLDQHRRAFTQEAIDKGLELKEEKLAFLIRNQLWSNEKEKELSLVSKQISDTEMLIKNLIIKKQINEAKAKIKKLKKTLSDLENEKFDVLGFCVEDYTNKKLNELIIYLSFYKDKDLTERFFTQEEFDSLQSGELSDLVDKLGSFYTKFDYEKVKRISASSFFMSLFSLCDDSAYNFFGKYVKDLTILQVNLFSQARYFKSLMESQAQSNPPSDVVSDPDKMVEWYESVENSAKTAGATGESSGVGYVGASREELEKMAGGKAMTLNEIAAKKGNKLTKEDFINMHGL